MHFVEDVNAKVAKYEGLDEALSFIIKRFIAIVVNGEIVTSQQPQDSSSLFDDGDGGGGDGAGVEEEEEKKKMEDEEMEDDSDWGVAQGEGEDENEYVIGIKEH